MTERNLGSHTSNWYGKVVNVKDPDQSGRVQVRIFGRHDDEQNIPDKDLPWVMPTQPVTSAALGKVGTAPLGLLKGSHVQGYWADKDHQIPIMTGSFGKSGEYKSKGAITDGVPEIDINKGSIPSASTNQSPPVDINPYSKLYDGRITINDINNGVKTVKDITRTTGIINKKAVDSKLKEATKPTTASADKSNKGDVLSIIQKVDPSGLSSTLPSAVGSFASVKDIMSMTSASGITNLMSGGIQGAIGQLAGQFGLKNVMLPMIALMNSNLLTGPAQNALKAAILSTIRNGPATGVVSRTVPAHNPAIHPLPLANLIVLASAVPSNYVQMYYDIDSEPYPGYIEWRDPDNRQLVVYSLRGNEPHYDSAEAHVTGTSAAALHGNMVGTLQAIPAGGTPTPAQLAALASAISGNLDITQAMGLTKILGKGASLANMAKMAAMLIPGIAGKIQGILSGQLPKSVLDAGKVTKTMNSFTKNQALLKKKKDNMKAAVEPNAAADTAEVQKYVATPDTPISQNEVNPATGNFIGITGETQLPTFQSGA